MARPAISCCGARLDRPARSPPRSPAGSSSRESADIRGDPNKSTVALTGSGTVIAVPRGPWRALSLIVHVLDRTQVVDPPRGTPRRTASTTTPNHAWSIRRRLSTMSDMFARELKSRPRNRANSTASIRGVAAGETVT